MKVSAVIAARMGSTRFPSKPLADLAGLPIIAHVINRSSGFPSINGLNDVVLAIPGTIDNKSLAEFGKTSGVKVFRGDEDDVLGRMLGAADFIGADVIYRVTGDNPLVDIGVVKATWDAFIDGAWDYAVMDFTPLGTTAEIITIDALKRAEKIASTDRLREHPTLALYENPVRFKMKLIAPPEKWQHPEWRFTVDTPDDLKFVEEIFRALGVDAGLDKIAPFLEKHPEIVAINSSVVQKDSDRLKKYKDVIGHV